jgi:hypothetical protein
MELYQITIPDSKSDKPLNIYVYVSSPITAMHMLVDLASDPNELYKDQIRDNLLNIFDVTYYDSKFNTDILMEPNVCHHYMHPEIFLNENRNNFKIFLEQYFTELEDYIVITKVRISAPPTITKSSR